MIERNCKHQSIQTPCPALSSESGHPPDFVIYPFSTAGNASPTCWLSNIRHWFCRGCSHLPFFYLTPSPQSHLSFRPQLKCFLLKRGLLRHQLSPPLPVWTLVITLLQHILSEALPNISFISLHLTVPIKSSHTRAGTVCPPQCCIPSTQVSTPQSRCCKHGQQKITGHGLARMGN